MPDVEPASLRILSLDGGGIRGLSSLLILDALMIELIATHGQGVKPCKAFNLICGTSAGGLNALMLSNLELNLSTCISHIGNVSYGVFGGGSRYASRGHMGIMQPKYSAVKMENVLQQIERTNWQIERDSPCKSYVVCRENRRIGNGQLVGERCISSFRNNPPHFSNCTLWEAGRATSAAYTYFKRMEINGRYFTDGGIGYNNPIKTVRRQEMTAGWDPAPARQCYVSIGTGRAADTEEEVYRSGWRARQRYFTLNYWKPHGLAGIPNAIAQATESHNDHIAFEEQINAARAGGNDFHYYRFDCEDGLGNIDLDKVDKLPEIISITRRYLARSDVKSNITACAQILARMM